MTKARTESGASDEGAPANPRAASLDGAPGGEAGPVDPQEIGGCRIEGRIATSSAGRVYRAVDLAAGKTVAVKVLFPVDRDPHAAARVLAAADKLVGLKHPHVVPVHRTGHTDALPFIVLDHVEGEDLERAVRRERGLVPAAAARVIIDSARGLDAVFSARLLAHGDVRPRHLLRTRGSTQVIGFSQSPPAWSAQGRRMQSHPAYTAPEVARGDGADARSDIYALGVSLFELVAGRTPFGSDGADALLACHVHEPFPSFASLGVRVPDELELFLQRMVAKAPERRFQRFGDVVEAGLAILPLLRRLPQQEPALVVEDGRQAGLRVALPDGDLIIGRMPDDGFALDDARCSRRHARLRRSGDYVEIEDLDSRNGVRVNGVEVRSRQVFPGDRIEIGDSVLRVEGRQAPVLQLPAVPASPVRGAFGDVEITHPRGRQASADVLSRPDAAALEERVRLLAQLAPVLARGGDTNAMKEVLAAVRTALRADESAWVRVREGQLVLDAATAAEAQVLSCVLPALERALPGQVALATTVRVGVDDRWNVLVGPVYQAQAVVCFLVLVRTHGAFDEQALSVLEACCALLTLRTESSG